MKALRSLLIPFVFALFFTGCNNPTASDDVPDMSISLTEAGKNAIHLTLNGASWNRDVEKSPDIKGCMFAILAWTKISGNISNVHELIMKFTRESDTVLLVEFFKGGYAGSGTVEICLEFATCLSKISDASAIHTDWTIHKNDPVTINII